MFFILSIAGGIKPTPSAPSSNAAIGPTQAPAPPKPQNINHTPQYISVSQTPYPNEGVILQSLNYIQMDVFSSFFSNSIENERNQRIERPQNYIKREPAVLSEALHNIENNFKSLF